MKAVTDACNRWLATLFYHVCSVQRGGVLVSAALLVLATGMPVHAGERLIYHDIRTDASGRILPWSHDEPGRAYDHVLGLVWKFWHSMRTDPNGLPYHMNHQVWQETVNDPRGIAGGQFEMMLNSWRLYYAYTGNEQVRENARFIADYYLTHGLSPGNCRWPNLPFPYNTLVYSGIYDGDMVIGRGYTQPDKAGGFGNELVKLARSFDFDLYLYPQATTRRYWEAAIAIADTLAARVVEGDADHSPLPFKVNVFTGETGRLLGNNWEGQAEGLSAYTTNWAGTLQLFRELADRRLGSHASYERAFATILTWMKRHPMQSNRWGPFFEDVPGWSDTQINAMTWARFIMDHRELFPEWQRDVRRIIDWVESTLANREWERYGVIAINEQTAYRVPGNSHTARQAADELYFAALTGDATRREPAIQRLNWATYMVDHDGKNRYPRDGIWMSDGYGDYVRHYLRAMAALPELAPANQTHLLSSTGVIQGVCYRNPVADVRYLEIPAKVPPERLLVAYMTEKKPGVEVLRVRTKPGRILLQGQPIAEGAADEPDTYSWRSLGADGILTIRRAGSNRVVVVE